MDKVLIAAFASAFVGLIVAAVNLVKLVNDKEGNVTDVKQAWALSLRSAMAELIAATDSYSSELYRIKRFQVEHDNILRGSKENTLTDKEVKKLDLCADSIKLSRTRCRDYAHSLQIAYATIKLHFKSEDLRFEFIELEIKKCLSALEELQDVKNKQHWTKYNQVISDSTANIAKKAMSILHIEWDSVKAGEPIYQKTKIGSLVFLVVMCLVVSLFAWLALSTPSKNSDAQPADQVIELKIR